MLNKWLLYFFGSVQKFKNKVERFEWSKVLTLEKNKNKSTIGIKSKLGSLEEDKIYKSWKKING